MGEVFARSYTAGTASPVMIVEPHNQIQHVWIHDHTKTGGRSLFIGGADVSETNGLHILGTETDRYLIPAGSPVFAIATGGEIQVQVFSSRL
jgi:hypothetical protein